MKSSITKVDINYGSIVMTGATRYDIIQMFGEACEHIVSYRWSRKYSQRNTSRFLSDFLAKRGPELTNSRHVSEEKGSYENISIS